MWDATSSQLTLNVMTYVAIVRTDYSGLHHLVLPGKCSVALRAKTSKRTPIRCTKVRSYMVFRMDLGTLLPVPLGDYRAGARTRGSDQSR